MTRRTIIGMGAGAAAAAVLAVVFLMGPLQTDVGMQDAPDKIPDAAMIVFESTLPALGDPDAPITIVEFGDYQCHFCNVFFKETEPRLKADYIDTGMVKLVFKDMTIIGPDSVSAANAAHCANEQGRFWDYHDVVYDNWAGENNGWAGIPNLLRFAEDIGLDMERFGECLDEKRYAQDVQDNLEDGRMLEVNGTPAFFVITGDNKVIKIPGAQPYEVFERVINEIA